MAPSLSSYASSLRLRARGSHDRPAHLDHSDDLPRPSSAVSTHSTRSMTGLSNRAPLAQHPVNTLAYAYMVCSVGRDPSQWIEAPAPSQGKINHTKGALNHFWLPEILGSSPKFDRDGEMAKCLHSAMRSCFPHDVEIFTGESRPDCVHHSFVIQQDSSHSYYGVALRVWSKADETTVRAIRNVWNTTGTISDENHDTYWIPYSLSFLSRYPLYDLLGDHIRNLWINCNNKATSLDPKEVSYLLRMPAPRLNELVRIETTGYALYYKFPASSSNFENFSLWPLFSCLSIPNIVGAVEAALSPTGRIILTSQHSSILTLASETLRKFVRVCEWSGLYMPIVHARHANVLVHEPGPYILGISTESRTVYNAPADSIIVDLDRNYVLNANLLKVFTPAQRIKMIARIAQALNNDVVPSGVPRHLQSAYIDGKLNPAGQIFVMRGEIESIRDPEWWNRDAVLAVMDHFCEKTTHNTGLKAVFSGNQKKPLMKKVSIMYLNELERDRNQYSRDTREAWQDFISLKSRMDTELGNVNRQNDILFKELESWGQQFLEFQTVVEKLTVEARDLKTKIETHKLENRRLKAAVDEYKEDSLRLAEYVASTEKQRDEAIEALAAQQELVEDLERQRQSNKMKLLDLQQHNATVIHQRDDAQRAVLHLRGLIDSQTHHLEEILRNINQGEVSEPAQIEKKSEAEETSEVEAEAEANDDRSSTGSDIESNSIIVSRTDRQVEPVTYSGTKARRHDAPRPLANRSDSEIIVTTSADRHLRDKTNDIAAIIRGISEQCAAAAEEIQLCQEADKDGESSEKNEMRSTFSTFYHSDSSLDLESDDGQFVPSYASLRSQPPDLIDNDDCTTTTDSRNSSISQYNSTIRSSFATTIDRGSTQYSNRNSNMLAYRLKDEEEDIKDRSGFTRDVSSLLSGFGIMKDFDRFN